MSTNHVAFNVPGTPQGKGRARAFVHKQSGKLVHMTPAKTRSYESLIQGRAMEAMGSRPPLGGPVEITLTIIMPLPKSWPAWKRGLAMQGRVMPTIKPDADNIEKAVKDALNGVVWKDDAQVVSTIKTKLYEGGEFRTAGVYVSVQAMPELPAQCKKRPQWGAP